MVTGGDRLSAEVLGYVNEAHRTSYRLVRRLAGGVQSGAWLVAGSDKPAVLKWSPDPAWRDQVLRANRAVRHIRALGYPTPAWLAVGATPAGHSYQVQELVAGRTAERLTLDRARLLVAVLEQHTGLDPDSQRSWSDFVENSFSQNWAATRRALEATSPAGAALINQCQRLLSRYERPALPRDDLVHGDFRLSNLLFDEGEVSGIVDIEALGSGTRVFDYATLLDHNAADPEAVELLIEAATTAAGEAVLAYCLVHVVAYLGLFIHRHPLGLTQPERDDRMRQLSQRVGQLDR